MGVIPAFNDRPWLSTLTCTRNPLRWNAKRKKSSDKCRLKNKLLSVLSPLFKKNEELKVTVHIYWPTVINSLSDFKQDWLLLLGFHE